MAFFDSINEGDIKKLTDEIEFSSDGFLNKFKDAKPCSEDVTTVDFQLLENRWSDR